MIGKLRIKFGQLEIEAEGSESFLRNDIPEILKFFNTLKEVSVSSELIEDEIPARNLITDISTSIVASKMGIKSGTDLVLAACFKLYLAGKQTFHRQDILSAMQEAKSFYNVSYRKNLTPSLKVLVVGKDLNETGKDTYSLSPNASQRATDLIKDS